MSRKFLVIQYFKYIEIKNKRFVVYCWNIRDINLCKKCIIISDHTDVHNAETESAIKDEEKKEKGIIAENKGSREINNS